MTFRDVEPRPKLQPAQISRDLQNRDDIDSAVLQHHNKANTRGSMNENDLPDNAPGPSGSGILNQMDLV